MTKPLSKTIWMSRTAGISRTAQACLWHISQGDDRMAGVLLRRIERRPGVTAANEAEMLRTTTKHAAGMLRDMMERAGWRLHQYWRRWHWAKTRLWNADWAAKHWQSAAKHWMDRALIAEAQAAKLKTERDDRVKRWNGLVEKWNKLVPERDNLRDRAEAAEAAAEKWKERAEIAEAQAARPWWRRLFAVVKKGPDAATSGPADEHTASTVRG